MKVAARWLAAGVVLVGCGGGDDAPAPGDAGPRPDAVVLVDAGIDDPNQLWAGTYRGMYEATAHDCDTGATLETDPPYLQERTLRVDGESLIVDINGCPVTLAVRIGDPLEADVLRSTCEAVLPNGARAMVSFTDGEASLLGGEELWMRLDYTVEHPGGCDEIGTSFTEGQRL